MVAFARCPGPSAFSPPTMPISRLIGPLTSWAKAKEFTERVIDSNWMSPNTDAVARITGR